MNKYHLVQDTPRAEVVASLALQELCRLFNTVKKMLNVPTEIQRRKSFLLAGTIGKTET